jgi:hypothetical protein
MTYYTDTVPPEAPRLSGTDYLGISALVLVGFAVIVALWLIA